MLNMLGPWKITKDEESRYLSWFYPFFSRPMTFEKINSSSTSGKKKHVCEDMELRVLNLDTCMAAS